LFDGFDNLTIVTPSEWLANKAKLSFLRSKCNIVITNGIDQTIFKPTDYSDLDIYPLIKDKKMILSVASDIMSENKGGQRILEIAKRPDNIDIIFVLVGVKLPEKIGLKNVIALKRTKSQLELAKFYSAASAFLTLSKSESFSLVCAEALACGAPVVGFDIGGISETVKFGFGTLKKYGDYDGIAEEINIISKRNANAKVISETYSDLYSKKTMYKNYFNLYSDNIISS